MGTLHQDLWTFMILPEFFLEWEMFHLEVVEKIETHILCSITFSKNHAIYEQCGKIW
jgi:hypothetical protein